MDLDLIFCAGNSTEYSKVASAAGFMLGSRTTESFSAELKMDFADVHYKQVNFDKHLVQIAKYADRLGHKVKYGIVPDLNDTVLSLSDIERALMQVSELKPYVENVILVPKLKSQIALLPQDLILGYSLPTKNGAAKYSFKCLRGRKVHLLGGSPHNQHKLYHWSKLDAACQVVSADGSMAKERAIGHCKYWQAGGACGGQWPPLPEDWNPVQERRLKTWGLSCGNIYAAWERLYDRFGGKTDAAKSKTG